MDIARIPARRARSRQADRRLRRVALIVSLALGSVAPLVPAHTASAAIGDCFFNNLNPTYTFTGFIDSDWNKAGNWDNNLIPSGGQVCIRSGYTVELANNGLLAGGGAFIRNYGIIRINGASVHSYYPNTIENYNRFEVSGGATFELDNSDPALGYSFFNRPGGVVSIANTGKFINDRTFQNLGGVVDLNGGGGTFVQNQITTARFIQGASAAPVTQSAVTNGKVTLQGGILQMSGTGSGIFEATTGNVFLEGQIGSNQEVDVSCGPGNFQTMLILNANVTNLGQLNMLPRKAGGTTCISYLNLNGAGVTLTNSGAFTVGTAAAATNEYVLMGTGSLTNSASGTTTVNAKLTDSVVPITSDGSVVTTPSGSMITSQGLFHLRNGAFTNNGSFKVDAAGTYRVTNGAQIGHDVVISNAFIETNGPGATAMEIPLQKFGTLRNQSGPIVVWPNQKVTVLGGWLATVDGPFASVAAENRGLITLTGDSGFDANIGSAPGSAVFTNTGTIIATHDGAANTGYNNFQQAIHNAAGGIIDIRAGKNCSFAHGIVNDGSLKMAATCNVSGSVSFGSTSNLTVHATAAAAAGFINLRDASSYGGHVTVITDSPAPDSGALLDFMTPLAGNTVTGAFAGISGAITPTLGYELRYPAGTGGKAQLAVVAGVFSVDPPSSEYSPSVPARLLDTRVGPSFATVDGQGLGTGLQPGGSVTEVQVAGRAGVPADAAAAALNVTVTEAQGAGYITVFPCGAPQPTASSLNYTIGQTIPNGVISKIGAGGKVCLFASVGTQLIVDVNGDFPASSSFASLVPARLLETRSGAGLVTVDGQGQGAGPLAGGAVTEVQITGRAGVPAGAAAAVLNVTSTNGQGAGYVTAFPCGSPQPTASSLNFLLGLTIPNGVISKIGSGGKVCLFASVGTDLIVDVNGWFPA
jgi:hypothetical protein